METAKILINSGHSVFVTGRDNSKLNNFQGSHWAPHLIHIETWNKVGGLSEEFFGAGSDPDLCIKLWKQGTRIFKGLSDFRVYHFSSIVSNKVDNSKKIKIIGEFYELGFDPIYPLSSINGSGTGELLDDLVLSLEEKKIENETQIPKFAVVGRPNAGKSSYINCLIGEERNIVTEKAGTTRDSIYSRYNLFGFDFNLVDTAGIRRKSKVKENIEFYSVIRSIRAIEYSDVCLLIVDATRGFDGQVQNIFWLAHRNQKGILILSLIHI